MQERLRVFVSSTSEDLTSYRDAVVNIILRLDLYPVFMETFNSTDRSPLQLCYDKVQQADIFVGIYAHRYGHIPSQESYYISRNGERHYSDGDKGITHLEYLWALEKGIKTLLYIVSDIDKKNDPLPWPTKYIEQGSGRTKLDSFKQTILKNHSVNFYYSPDHLASQVATSVAMELRNLGTNTHIIQLNNLNNVNISQKQAVSSIRRFRRFLSGNLLRDNRE